MAISDNDSKLLWGRAAGICSNPDCRKDLTILLGVGRDFTIGEMAHVIAQKPSGPRGVPDGGSDAYANLILLCPSCHRTIDKAPAGQYPEALLHGWKAEHEAAIRTTGRDLTFADAAKLKHAVNRLLLENHILWRDLGPHSNVSANDPGSNLHRVWALRKLDTIIPNNRKIINYIECNKQLLDLRELEAFLLFKAHASAFEEHQYSRLDDYPKFPQAFARVFAV